MNRGRFEALVQEALGKIPGRFRRQIKNLALVVEDEPPDELLRQMGIDPSSDTLFGLYHGTPLTHRAWDFGNALPDQITLFQRPIEAACETEAEIVAAIGETLIHELGHYFGLTEAEIEAIEEHYWRQAGEDHEGEDEA